MVYYEDEASNNQKSISFSDLKKNNVSVNELLKYSTSIDTLERYQMYLIDNITNGNIDRLQRFYYCTPPFFGPVCQFKFDREDLSFTQNIALSIWPPFDYGSTHTTDPGKQILD